MYGFRATPDFANQNAVKASPRIATTPGLLTPEPPLAEPPKPKTYKPKTLRVTI